MVGDDQLDPQPFCGRGLFETRDAVVHGDEQLCAISRQLFQCGVVESVALIQSVGDVVVCVCFEEREATHQDRGGRHSVCIVVAIDGNLLASLDRGEDSRCRLGDAGKLARRTQIHQVGVKKTISLIGRIDAAVHEQFGNHTRDACGAFHLLRELLVAGTNAPLLAHGIPSTKLRPQRKERCGPNPRTQV